MKNIFLILILILITSCSLQHRLDKYCPICPRETVKSDSIFIYTHDTLLSVDTIWKVRPADSASIKALVNCNDGIANMDTIITNTGKVKITASINEGILNVSAKCPADSLMTILTKTRLEYKEYRDKQENTTKFINVYPRKFFYYWFAGSLLILAFIAYNKFKNRII